MQSLNDFIKKIDGKLAAEEEQILAHQQSLNRQHEVRTTRLGIYTKIADQVLDNVIRPRMERLVSYFENASLSSQDANGRRLICRFEVSPRFPAGTTLDFWVSHDDGIENIDIIWSLQILPVFMKFDKRGALSISLDDPDESRLVEWVEKTLLNFLDIYFQLAHHEQYQKQNLVRDPVCGTQVNKAFAISETCQGSQRYYFCTEDCRAKFILEAERPGPSRPLEGGAELHTIGSEKHPSHSARKSPMSSVSN
jgi:YHS domain-containing protein